MRSSLVIAIAMLIPAFAGCMSDSGPAVVDDGVAANAEAAGALAGPAPAAPQTPYRVTAKDEANGGESVVTAYPVRLRTSAAKEPVTLEFDGEYKPNQCTLFGNLDPSTSSFRRYDLSESLQTGDVLSYVISLTWTNTDDSWADLHLSFGMGTRSEWDSEPQAEKRGEVIQTYDGQTYRIDGDAPAYAAIACYYGSIREAIQYKIAVTFTFASNALPAETPVLLAVPDNATRLFVRGVPTDLTKGVTSHYRVFAPDDTLLCECALNSNEEVDTFELPAAGDYVILVDHTENGFVALALDAPSPESLIPLDAEWITHTIYTSTGETNVDTVKTIELNSVPLVVSAWAWMPSEPPLTTGAGKKLQVTITNGRGQVLHTSFGGYVAYTVMTPVAAMSSWRGMWPADWAFEDDHHLYAKGAHEVHVTAEAFRGEVLVFTRHYVRV